jgi:hypothetical protein
LKFSGIRQVQAKNKPELADVVLSSAYDLGTKSGNRVIGYEFETDFLTLDRICVYGDDGRVMFPGILEMGRYIDL